MGHFICRMLLIGGEGSCVDAELMVIKWGMQKACDDGIPKSEVEVDSQLIKWRRGSTLEAAEFV